MTKQKSTKRALIASVLSLALCFTMLVGSTFAWFTDSATTGVNQIVSGNLEIVLVDENGNEITEALKWKVSDGKTQADIFWEPGCTYELQEVFVKNKGNLAVTFAVSVTGIEASDAKLNEVIDWTVTLPDGGLLPAGETSDAVDIVAHMQETAGNDYMNQTIDGVTVAVYATQVSYENDSYGNTYDHAAKDDEKYVNQFNPVEPFVIDKENKVITINTATAFMDLAKGAEAFGLGINDYPDAYTVKLAGNLSLNGAKLTEPIECWWGTLDGCDKTISNVEVNTTENWAGLFKPGASENTLNIKNLTLDNVHVKTTADGAFAGVVVGYSANATLDNIKVTNSSVVGTKYSGGIIGQAGSTNITNCSAENIEVTGTRIGGIVGDAFNEGGTASVVNCSVNGVTLINTDAADGTSGSIAGRLRNGMTADNCTADNVTGATELVGASMS